MGRNMDLGKYRYITVFRMYSQENKQQISKTGV